MKKCSENLDRILPIFDKIVKKTLCLQNYLLNDGHCSGLAEACQHLDHRVVNRMLFNNCGITGDQMATILDGISKLKDFKALIYKNNELNRPAIQKLSHLLERGVPNHMLELQIIDCKMSATLIEDLMENLSESKLKKFALVNVHHSDSSFDKVVEYVHESLYLRDLNLTWSNVRPALMLRLLKEIQTNASLHNLSLGFNQLLEEEIESKSLPTVMPGIDDEEEKADEPLSEFNSEVVNCFKDFIKYNIYLNHLDLQSAGLNVTAIKFITGLLRKS